MEGESRSCKTCKEATMTGKTINLRGNISFHCPENIGRMLSREFGNSDLKDDSIKTSVMTKLSTIQCGTGR